MQSTQLPFLVDDVWHIIVDILCQVHPPNHAHDDKKNSEQWKPTGTGPADLFTHLRSLIHLSCTCKRLRDLVAPRIFKTLCLQNTAKSALSIQAIASGEHSAYVRNLHYIGSCESGTYLSLDSLNFESKLRETYPPEVNNVLSNLSRFPNLHHLTIEFPFDGREFWSNYYLAGSINHHLPELALTHENQNVWRGLMAASFNAIVSDVQLAGQIDSLEIRHLNIAAVSTFSTPAFGTFLSRLRTFSLSIKPIAIDGGLSLNSTTVFGSFMDCLTPWFMSHLRSVEEFTFDPSKCSPLGDAGQARSHDIGLQQCHMPRLRKLTLRNIVVCAELRDFILRHSETLEDITLHDCSAVTYRYRNNVKRITWCDLFTALSSGDPHRPPILLKSFQLHYGKNERELSIWQIKEEWGGDSPPLTQAIKKISAHSGARAFSYFKIRQSYGIQTRDTQVILDSFLAGDDARSYQDLMRIVESNAGI